MQFKQPDILYFLFLLIIPILVHLFQLRKFKKEYFTNVQILKQLSIQTRKSSKIKKWLLLASRLLLLSALIIVFAQPFFTATDSLNANNELYIVLDNSFSMQAKGQKGPLLKRAVEDLLTTVPENQQFSLVTCSSSFFQTNIKSIQKDLQNLDYSASTFEIDRIITQINAKKSAFSKDILVITDANGITLKQLKSIEKTTNLNFYLPRAEKQNNVSIDSVYLSKTSDNFYEISAKLSAFGDDLKPVAISLYNQKKLEAKTILNFDNTSKIQIFTIPKADFHGYINIEDGSLDYDNTYFFSIAKAEKTNLISIGTTEKSKFLGKIYTETDFNYKNYELASLDYNAIEKQDAVLLNELTILPDALQVTLKNFVEKGGNLILIPASDQNIVLTNNFLNNFGNYQYQEIINAEKQITKIVFEHPIYADVFSKKITSFQYPNTKSSFGVSTTASTILGYSDQTPFLASLKYKLSNVFIFSSPINKQNSNFQNAPLIVPTIFNMGKSNKLNEIVAFVIANKNSFVATAALTKDEILEVRNDFESFVPLQQILNQKIKITFNDLPKTSGNFGLFNKENLVNNVSFNYNRTEGNLAEINNNLFSDFKITNSIDSFFDNLQFNRTDSQLWKLFLIMAVFFLCIEVLIQKFVK